jgi:hypothetical protein
MKGVRSLTTRSGLLPVVVAVATLMFSDRVGATNGRQASCVLVRNAELALTAPLDQPFWGALRGHEVKGNSSRSVLLVRIFDDPGSGPDSQIFTKLSIEFSGSEPVYPQVDESKILRSYFVQGMTGFVSKKRFFVADSLRVRLGLTKAGDATRLQLESTVQSRSAFDGSEQVAQVAITCQLKIKQVHELSPWEGRIGTDWASFAPEQ